MSQNEYKGLEKLYEDHRKLVYAFVSDYSTEDAFMEEISSTVWMKVWEKADFFLNMDKVSIKYYLRAMVKTTVSDYFRCIEKENKKIQKLKETLLDSAQLEDDVAPLFLENMSYYLREAINMLTEEEKLLIIMRFKHNRSAKEIGSYLGITEGNVRVRQLRILTKMKNTINNLIVEEKNENGSKDK